MQNVSQTTNNVRKIQFLLLVVPKTKWNFSVKQFCKNLIHITQSFILSLTEHWQLRIWPSWRKSSWSVIPQRSRWRLWEESRKLRSQRPWWQSQGGGIRRWPRGLQSQYQDDWKTGWRPQRPRQCESDRSQARRSCRSSCLWTSVRVLCVPLLR